MALSNVKWGRPPQLEIPPEAIAAPDLARSIREWQAWLDSERRCSPHTLAAYRRDLWAFLRFFAESRDKLPTVDDLRDFRSSDLRPSLLNRARRSLKASSTGRAHSVIRNFFRFLLRREVIAGAPMLAMRRPKVPYGVPKALSVSEAMDAVQGSADVRVAPLMRRLRPWVALRDEAVLSLLYGCGLRLSEAL